ncbi:MAG: ABC transporter permease [Clostridiales bacterium]|nr:ABC transporter permease [Clostridiales bacterium]
MRKHLSLIWLLLKLRLSRAMMYRLSFFGAFFVDGAMVTTQLIAFQAIYAGVDSIAGWGRAEALLFVGTFSLVNALNMVVFFFGINGLADKVKTGELDGYLVKPMNPLVRLTFENIDLGSVPLLLYSAAILSYAGRLLPSPPTPGRVLGYVGMALAMTLLWYDLMLILRSISFYTTSVKGIQRVEGSLIELNMRLPGVAFRGAFKALFMLVLPYGLIGTVPAEVMAGLIAPAGAAYALAIAAAFTGLALGLFRAGLRRYDSAGG